MAVATGVAQTALSYCSGPFRFWVPTLSATSRFGVCREQDRWPHHGVESSPFLTEWNTAEACMSRGILIFIEQCALGYEGVSNPLDQDQGALCEAHEDRPCPGCFHVTVQIEAWLAHDGLPIRDAHATAADPHRVPMQIPDSRARVRAGVFRHDSCFVDRPISRACWRHDHDASRWDCLMWRSAT